MKGLISYANGSISSLYGCIGYTVQDMIIKELGPKFFNYVSMSSELATRNVRRVLGSNSNREIAKRLKPELIIQPTFATMDESGPLQGIPLTSNFQNLQYRTDKRYLLEAIRDKKYGYSLKFRLNRDRIDYDVTIALDTLEQQINVYKILQNKFVWNITQGMEIALESVIPKRLIGMMSKLCNMDLDKHLDYIPILLRRLNSCSTYPITYKIKNSTATDEWFLYYTHIVHFTFTDLSLESGSKRGMSEDRYPITFRVSAEFNLPGMYFLEGMSTFVTGLDVSLLSTGYGYEESEYFPLFTIPNIYQRFPPEINGMQLYGSSIFKTDPPKDRSQPMIDDRINIQGILDNDHIRVIRTYVAWNMNPQTLLRVFVTKNRENLTEGEDFTFDFNTLDLIVKKPDEYATYRIAIYFNYNAVNEILSNEKYDTIYDTPELKKKEFISHAEIDPKTISQNMDTRIPNEIPESDTSTDQEEAISEEEIPEEIKEIPEPEPEKEIEVPLKPDRAKIYHPYPEDIYSLSPAELHNARLVDPELKLQLNDKKVIEEIAESKVPKKKYSSSVN